MVTGSPSSQIAQFSQDDNPWEDVDMPEGFDPDKNQFLDDKDATQRKLEGLESAESELSQALEKRIADSYVTLGKFLQDCSNIDHLERRINADGLGYVDVNYRKGKLRVTVEYQRPIGTYDEIVIDIKGNRKGTPSVEIKLSDPQSRGGSDFYSAWAAYLSGGLGAGFAGGLLLKVFNVLRGFGREALDACGAAVGVLGAIAGGVLVGYTAFKGTRKVYDYVKGDKFSLKELSKHPNANVISEVLSQIGRIPQYVAKALEDRTRETKAKYDMLA